MKRARGGKSRGPKIKTIKVKAKHAKAVRTSHLLSLGLFTLVGLGIILIGFIYVYNQYDQQQNINSLSRDQLDYGIYQSAPIDTITFAVLAAGLVLAIFGVALTMLAMAKHSAKHHVYRVASGHYVPVPHGTPKKLQHEDVPFTIGQTEESRHQAQAAARQKIAVTETAQAKPKSILIQ